ncbi:MAG: hypothetical protein CBB97_25800 [Candidatus Endolissoclinum sp. TMED37]|nr:MAG: hypothetical protein CBB97_25800 [Candidatus Endolissoclinum sp. TMED37]
MTSAYRREQKYQWTRLHRSGRTLTEIKALTKGTAVGLHKEYANTKQVADLERIQTGLERLTMTRIDARELKYEHFFKKPSNIGGNREDQLASFLNTGRAGAIDWSRDGNLIRKGKPNKPRPGSSKNIPIGRTVIRGERKLLQDWKKLFAAFNQLTEKDRKALSKDIKAKVRSFRASVKG